MNEEALAPRPRSGAARGCRAGATGLALGHGLVFYGSTDWLVCANTSSTW